MKISSNVQRNKRVILSEAKDLTIAMEVPRILRTQRRSHDIPFDALNVESQRDSRRFIGVCARSLTLFGMTTHGSFSGI
jgi:hypothetical protein